MMDKSLNNLAVSKQSIQMTVVGGYLGAGKTTLINHMLTHQDMSNCVFLINDFGSFNIDANLISARGANTIELENGCICCSIVDGLISTLLKLVRRKPRPHRIIIEASGVSDPAKVADIARISQSLMLDKVVVVVDAKRIRQTVNDALIGDMLLKQLAAADLLLLNKTETLSNNEQNSLCDWLRQSAPTAALFPTCYARLPMTILFNDNHSTLLGSPLQESQLSQEPVPESETEFKAWSYESSQPFNRAEFGKLLDSLPNTIQRMKGFVIFEGSSETPYLLQMTSNCWTLSKELASLQEPAKNQLNVIGNKNFSSVELAKKLSYAQSYSQ